jgi:hypothetical protein
MDVFGAQFLPLVSDAMTFLVEKVFPAFQKVLDDVGPIITDIAENYIGPLFDSVGELFALFNNADFSIVDAALGLLKGTLDAIKTVIDFIVAGMKFIGVGGGNGVAKALNKAAGDAGYNGGSYVNPMNRGGNTSTTLTTNTNLYLDGSIVAQSTSGYLGGYVTTTNGSRNTGRYP